MKKHKSYAPPNIIVKTDNLENWKKENMPSSIRGKVKINIRYLVAMAVFGVVLGSAKLEIWQTVILFVMFSWADLIGSPVLRADE